MTSTRNIATTILVTLGASLAFATAQAQSTATQITDSTPQVSTSPATKTPGIDQGTGQGMEHGTSHGKHNGKHHGMKDQRSELSKLMTPEERTEMRNKMQAAKTPEERQAIRTSMRSEMQKRAKEKGITLPEHQGRQHRHGAHSG